MICTKTEAGQLAFKTRSGEIPPRLRSVFLLFDGKKSVDTILAMTNLFGTVKEDIDYLIASGMLAIAPDMAEAQALKLAESKEIASAKQQLHAEMFARAWPIATQITASMGLRGFRLNLAVEAAMGYEQLCDLLPKLKEAVGEEKTLPLEIALGKA
jgi:hypothetical protein